MADNIIRQSQLITTYGPGAMLDLPEYSVIVSGLQDWSLVRREEVKEPRLVAKLRQWLEVPELRLYSPPRHEAETKDPAPVWAYIFPTWFIVKDARVSPLNRTWRRRRLVRLHDLTRRHFRDEDGQRKPVVPVRFVCGCRRGHIDDLRWRLFIHSGRKGCERPLWLEERGTSGDIADTYGVCDCGAERALYEAFGGVGRPGGSGSALGACWGKRPWIGPHAGEDCEEPYRLLVRTASNSYFPQKMSVISLPEFDTAVAAKIKQHHERLKTLDDLNILARFREVPELAAAFAEIDDASVVAEYRRQKAGGVDVDVPVKVAEFAILDKGDQRIGEDSPDSMFLAETLDRSAWDRVGPGPEANAARPDVNDLRLDVIDKVVLVHRLREVVSVLGFTRFEAVNADKDGEIDLQVEPAALAETIDWLPAIENRGEGVFVSFRRDAVEAWFERVATSGRARQIEAGWKVWAQEHDRPEGKFPGLPYMMLHSVSHMLMTSIALECGYPVSSLRERVYAGKEGFGILIYTASSDADGTLGGLVETGRQFAAHLHRALRDNRLCSNDPVCAEHAPDTAYEGRPLQGAACHGCLLIAETSCEQRNDFLDRALVVRTVGVEDAAFFDPAPSGHA